MRKLRLLNVRLKDIKHFLRLKPYNIKKGKSYIFLWDISLTLCIERVSSFYTPTQAVLPSFTSFFDFQFLSSGAHTKNRIIS